MLTNKQVTLSNGWVLTIAPPTAFDNKIGLLMYSRLSTAEERKNPRLMAELTWFLNVWVATREVEGAPFEWVGSDTLPSRDEIRPVFEAFKQHVDPRALREWENAVDSVSAPMADPEVTSDNEGEEDEHHNE